MYLYETHCHTGIASQCARMSAEELVDFYVKNGYTGIFVTDHFINGNARVNYEKPNAPYEEKVEDFLLGYEKVKAAAKGRLSVFFGLEYSYKGTDVLVYGMEKEDLLSLTPELLSDMRKFIEYARARGFLTVQAHPFREAGYIDHIRLFSGAEAVEAFNANRDELCNYLGGVYADAYKKRKLGGSDLHANGQKLLSGMAFEEPVLSEADFIRKIREGKGEIVKRENVLLSADGE